MKDDPIITEIHKIRKEILNECNNDIEKYLERLKIAELKDKDRLVSLEKLNEEKLLTNA
jgi:hypothetical protein